MREIEPSDLPDFCSQPTLVLGWGNTLPDFTETWVVEHEGHPQPALR